MAERPYTLLSCGMSLDGYLDSASEQRLLLSNAADFDRVDAERAGCDAILVGAETVRRDNPRLVIRDPSRSARRVAAGLGATPMKVTVTGSGALDPQASFFTVGETHKLVYGPTSAVSGLRSRLDGAATVVDAGTVVAMDWVGADLHRRGVRRLMVEGGGSVLTQFLTAGLADELHLVVAPFFIGDSRARRFVEDGVFPCSPEQPAQLIDVQRMDEVVLLRYGLSGRSFLG